MSSHMGVVVITGGSRGIGAATALAAARDGWSVAVNYRADAEAAERVVAQVREAGGEALAVRGDISNPGDVGRLFAEADALGPLKGLVNNAGIVGDKQRVDEMPVERLERMMRVNVIGSILTAQEAVRRMSTRHGGKGGVIVNISSVAARLGSPGEYVDYAASKGAIDTFTRGLALEVVEEGIRVNAVRPGITDTEIHASGGQPDRVARIAPTIPMKREGKAEEIAEAVVWLLSGRSSYVTGTVVDVSGGR